jgi:hypothetical protein
VRAEQTVAEMVVVALARQAEALSEGTDRPLEEAFAQVLETPAGRLLGELADGPHRHEKAADWQEGLIADRVVRRKARRPHARGGGYGGAQPRERAEEAEAHLAGQRQRSLQAAIGADTRARTGSRA